LWIATENFQKTKEESAKETSSTTTFSSDGTSVSNEQKNAVMVPMSYLNDSTTHMVQDLVSFLEKPVIVEDGTMTSASTGILDQVNLPDDLLAIPVYQEKLSGFQLVSGDIHIKVTLNATPMQQGRIILAFIPQAQVTGCLPELRLMNPQLITQLPHTELSLADDRECNLVIPYTAPSSAYDLIAGSGPWGSLYLYVYAPLRYGTGSSTSVGYTIFAHFDRKTLRLMNPTYNTLTSALRTARIKKKLSAGQFKTNMSVPEKEASKMGLKPISSTLDAVASVAGSLSSVPMLSSVAKPVSWATALLGGAASAFGYSKPRDESGARFIITAIAPQSQNVDGVDNSKQLAAFNSNQVAVLPGFAGTDMDQLSFSYLCPIKTWFQTTTLDSTSTSGTVLAHLTMCATTFVRTLTDGTVEYCTFPPVCHLCYVFSRYRGSFILTLKLSKTKYHSGRLLIAFYPGLGASDTPTLDQAAYAHSAIFDLSTATEFTFKCPYTASQPYLDQFNPYGLVRVYVLTPLAITGDVSTTIDILWEVSGEGFEFAIPEYEDCWLPYVPSTIVPLAARRAKEAEEKRVAKLRDHLKRVPSLRSKVEPEKGKSHITPPSRGFSDMKTNSNIDISNDLKPVVQTIGASTVTKAQVDMASYCIGEQIISWRSLMKRFQVTNSIISGTVPGYDIRPFTTGVVTGDGTYTYVQSFCWDLWSLLGMMYAYNRGGIRLKMYNQMNSACTARAYIADSGATGDPINIYNQVHSLFATPSNVNDFTVTHAMELAMPQYHGMHSRLCRPSMLSIPEPLDEFASFEHVKIAFNPTSVNSANITFQRAAAEDSDFGFFLGIPPLIASTNLNPAPMSAPGELTTTSVSSASLGQY
jgi:hypothetical protein